MALFKSAGARIYGSGSAGIGVLLALLSASCFSTLGLFAKLIYSEGFSTPQALAWRFTGAAVILWGWVLVKDRRFPSFRENFPVLVLGILGFAPQAGLYFATLRFLDPGITSLLLYLYPSFVVLFSAVFLKRIPTRAQIGALGLSLVGCVVTFFRAGRYPAVGIALGVLVAVTYGAYLVVGERVLKDRSPVRSTAFLITGAACVYWLLVGITGSFKAPREPLSCLGLVGVSLVATVLPIVTLFASMQRIGASNASLISTVEPLVTILLSAFILGERLGPAQLTGGALIVGAVVLIQAGTRRNSASPHAVESPRPDRPA